MPAKLASETFLSSGLSSKYVTCCFTPSQPLRLYRGEGLSSRQAPRDLLWKKKFCQHSPDRTILLFLLLLLIKRFVTRKNNCLIETAHNTSFFGCWYCGQRHCRHCDTPFSAQASDHMTLNDFRRRYVTRSTFTCCGCKLKRRRFGGGGLGRVWGGWVFRQNNFARAQKEKKKSARLCNDRTRPLAFVTIAGSATIAGSVCVSVCVCVHGSGIRTLPGGGERGQI